jgi:hypothetical protein
MRLELNGKVEHLLSQFELVDVEGFINHELCMLLKNKLYNGRCYLNFRVPKDVADRVDFLKDKTGLSFSKVALLGINELYLDYQNDVKESLCN